MTRTLFDYLGFIITAIGTLFGAIGLYLTLQSKIPVKDLITQITLILTISTFVFLVLFLLFLKKFIVHLRYAKSYDTISAAFSVSHKLRDSNDINDLPKCIQSLQEFCSHINAAFTTMTNRTTSVCIKLFHIADNGDVCLQTLCRDSKARESQERINPEEDDCIHYLSENTDFKYIFENVNKDGADYKYFMSNGLPFEDFYRNTRIDESKYPPKTKFPIVKEIRRYFAWCLPYKSTITVPITPLTDKKITESQIVGYLCVDSPFLWAFYPKYDIKILRGIADGLYPTVKRVSDIHFQSVHNSTKQTKKSATK